MICKVAKKGLIGAAVGAAALALIFGTAAPSYVKTTFHKARQSVKGSVPVEFEIERAKQEIANLKPAIEGAIETEVEAEIQARNLAKEIADAREELNLDGRRLQALNERLKTGDLHLTSGEPYSERSAKNDLARMMDRYKIAKTILLEKQETLKIRQRNVASAHEGRTAMQNAERDLTARVQAAEARLNQIKASRTSNEFSFDDTAVGQAKKIVSDVEAQLEKMARVDDLKGKYADHGSSPTIDPLRDVVKEIDAEFNSAPKNSEKAIGEKY